ncbi:RHS repeat protein, partial [Calidithermus terrae]|uniref:RHS repeat protein n=1 Tax=Calidithermus terrae TaxID=1408545 RepID=UPI0011C46AF2
MRHRPWLWRDTTRRRLALLTLILFLLANYGPGTLVLAVPQLFVRPGAGVSRLPLEVMAFEAPGFGELEEAINLASGNLYVGTDQLGRNNLATSGTDETTITIGGRNWNLLPRLRLAPYSNGLSSPPASFFLGKGDGSGQTFNRVTTDFASEPLKSAPSWIQRYKSAGTAPLPDVHLYALAAQPGTQYSQEWVVLLIRPSGRTIAHYYIADGTRYSFNGDGQFVSYSQTPHQQYRGARFNNDPEGEKYDTGSNPNIVCKNTTNAAAPCTPRTDFFYTGGGSGMISKVRDEWGRVSVYTWDTALKTLQRIDYLVRDQANPATTWSRQVEFGYKAFVGQPQNLLGWVTYRAPDGMGGTLERRFEFDYDQRPGGRVVLKAVKRSAAGQNYAHVTIYDYDSSDRVIRVDPPGDGALVYTYGTGSDAGGAKVTVTECKNARLQDGLPACDDSASRKYAEYHFDPAGQLAKRREREHNPWVAQNSWTQRPDERWRAWTYSYWPDGSTKEVTGPYTEGEAEPRKLYLEYDARGNVKLERLSLGANVVREKTWTYTADNRLLSENIPAYPGTGFNYSAVRESSSYTDHPAVSVNGQTFRAVEWAETSTLVRNGDIWFTQYTLADRYDEAGRLARSERRLPGQPDKTQTTTYAYHSGSGTWQPYVPDANGSYAPAGPLVRQYADLVYERDHQGRLGRYFYDALGNVNHELLPGQHTADYSGATEVRHYRWAFRSYNGFGQQVWEHLFVSPDGNNGVTPARRMWFYLPTGELDHSWEGQPTNVTDYEYHTSGGNVGRLKKVTRGVGAGGSVTTVRETTEVPAADGYDAYGRRVKWTVDGFGYAAQYDTLDRLVRETLPDGGYTGMAYHASGERDIEFFYPANSRLDTILGWVKAVDGLGRVASTSYDAHTWGSVNSGQRGAQVRTFYDPFDRPIRVEDDRLTMNNPGEDRTTYFVYDSTGNLVKRLDPPLRTNGNVDMGGVSPGYTDGRRPYVEYSYDTLGRRTQERRLLAGNVTPAQVYNNLYGSFATCGSSAVACTSTAYDVLDRPVTVTDPEGYATTLAYDPAGNLVSKTQQVWTGSEPDYATLNGNFTSVTTRYAYDGVGRVVETIDPRGYTRGVTYDILGNLRQEWDERGVLVKNYTYTDDGLLSAVLEPDNVAGTPANVLGDGHVTTKALEYGSRRFPTRTCVAHMDTQAGAEAACTSHTYDYAGRVLSDTLPDNSTVVITYDSRGNRTSLKDAEGFVAEYTHDAWGNLVQELKKSRGNQTDSASGFPDGSGLLSQYWYDYAGNLVKQRSNGAPGEDNTGLYTEYAYNSLGKVVRETRPHRQDLIPNMRMKTYRLDGRLTAETTYDYSGDLAGKVASVGVDNMPTVSAGNATVYEYNRRGDKTREASQASPVTSPIHPALNWDGRERTVTFQYNGLGLLVKRLFTGTDRVYATQRDADGRPLTQRVDVVINGITLPYYVGNVNHNSYRRHDANSNLVESWDTPTSASGDGTPISANDKQNRYTYQYSSTNKESYHTRDVRFKVRSYYNTPNHDFSNGALMAATIGSATTVYNERDQINSVNYYDEAPKDWSATGKATSNIVTYSYYRSGLKKRALTGDGNYTDYVYDKRGRVTTVTDSNGGRDNTGGTTIPGPAVTSTTYDPDGTQTQELKTGSTLRYKLVTRPTLSGLTGSTDEWTVQGMLQSPAHPVSQVTVYRATGHPYAGLPYRSTTTTAQGWPGPENAYSSTTSTATFTYDGYGNRTQHAQETVTTGRRWNSDCQCYRPFDETSSYVPKTAAYNGVNAVTSETVGTPPGCSDSTCYGYTLTYTLSSRGDRLSVSDSRGAKPFTYHGRSKRYDAEGRAAIFQITEDSNTYPASKPAGKTSNYTAFRYDPFGSQVLAANGWTWEQDGSNQAQHAMYRETYTNVVVGGRVHTTRRQWGQMAWYWHLYGWEHRTEWNSNNVYKDEAYSLADGALESPWTAVMPYGTYAMFVKPPVLALPTAALSSQLRLSVGNVSLLDLRPPAAGPSGNTNTPAPPARLTQPDQG